MNALYSVGQTVPLGRVIREHRAALLPLGVVLALNVIVLVAVVLPLSRSVTSREQQAEAAEREQAAAQAEFTQAEALREGKARATQDLDTFYRQVLPSNVTVARRLLGLKLQVLAREHDVRFENSSTTELEERDSNLLQLTGQVVLSGDYDDIRALIYALETSSDFLVIDKVVLTEGQDSDAPLSVTMGVSTYYRVPSAAARTGADGR
jgi:hypothetical protein